MMDKKTNKCGNMKKVISIILSIVMVFNMCKTYGISANNNWTIEILKIETVKSLVTIEKIENYDGTVSTIKHENLPSDGNCYVIATVYCENRLSRESSLDSNLILLEHEDQRVENMDSSFLQDHNYVILPKIIRTTSVGSVCFEVPEDYMENTFFSATIRIDDCISMPYMGTKMEVPYKLNEIDTEAQVEKNILKSYEDRGKATIDDAYIVKDVYGNAPLTALAIFETESACEVEVIVHGKDNNLTGDISYTVNHPSVHHEVPIFGLYPNYENTVTISTGERSVDYKIITDAVPENMTTVSKVVDNGEQISEQLFLLQAPYQIVFDNNGDIRWYFDKKWSTENCCYLFEFDKENSSFWFSYNRVTENIYTSCSEIVHMNWLGKVEGLYSYDKINEARAHHDATLLPNGHLLYWSQNTLSEINPETGERNLYLDLDNWILDNSFGSIDATEGGSTDWAHPNTVQYVDGKLLISLRNQHLVFLMDYFSKEIDWVLTPSYYTNGENQIIAYQNSLTDKLILPSVEDNEFEWFYSQHMPYFISYDKERKSFDLVLFDNGSVRYIYGEESNDERYSRIVRYQIDELNKTVKQIYEYGKERGSELYSFHYGSSVYLHENEHYVSNFRLYNGTVNSHILETVSGGAIVAEYEVGNASCGSYRANVFNVSDAFENLELGLNKGVEYHEYSNSNWNVVDNVDGSTLEQAAINELSRTDDTISLYGFAKVENSAYTEEVSLIAVGNKGMYAISLPVLNISTGAFYGVGISLETLPDDEYDLYIRAKNGRGIYGYEVLEYKLTIGEEKSEPKVISSDIIIAQNLIDDSIISTYQSNTFLIDSPYVVTNPYGLSPLSAVALFKTHKEASIDITIKGKNGTADITNSFTDISTEHIIPIYGLYAGESTEVWLEANYTDGTSEKAVIQVSGDSVPSDCLEATVSVADKTKMKDGLTFTTCSSAMNYSKAIDSDGRLRWILNSKNMGQAGPLYVLKNGHILITSEKQITSYYKSSFYEMDLSGKVYKEYVVNGVHHDIIEMDNGNFLVLVNNVNGETVEDCMVELDRETGEIVRAWDYYSLLGGQKISDVNYGSSSEDWFHNNGLAYDAASNTVLLSGRQQDMVIKVDLNTGSLVWVLSDPNDSFTEYTASKLLTPMGEDFEYQYGQHNVSLLPNGDIMVFDNGDYRSKDTNYLPAVDGYSRAVVYRVDEVNMTVEQIWSFGKELGSDTLSAYVSGALYLDENHYLIDFGGIAKNSAGVATYELREGIFGGTSRSEIYEVVDDEVVFHASYSASALAGNTYRASRMSPYTTTEEIKLGESGERLGGLWNTGIAETVNFSEYVENTNLGAENVTVKDDGVRLNVTLTATGASENGLKMLFKGNDETYAVSLGLPATVSEYVINNAEIPNGEYQLYLADGNLYTKLNLVWNNEAYIAERPLGYQITAASVDDKKGIVSSSGVFYDNTMTSVVAVENEGYQFVNWTDMDTQQWVSNDVRYTFLPTKKLNLRANFKEEEKNLVTVTFETNDGIAIASIVGEAGTVIAAPAVPVRSGYTFLGWYSDASLTTEYVFTVIPEQNITVYAKWRRNSTNGSSDSSGGSSSNDNISTVSSSIQSVINNVLGSNVAIMSTTRNVEGTLAVLSTGDIVFVKSELVLAKSEWESVNGQWYYFGTDAKAVSGWIQSSDKKWYYLDNVSRTMKTDWQLIGGQWYYMDRSNGDMKTDWLWWNNSWYYLEESGTMKVNWLWWNNDWYYMNPNGDMGIGWTYVNGKWYYMDSMGKCMMNGITPDGYLVDADGAWKENN